jgi:cytochrome c556
MVSNDYDQVARVFEEIAQLGQPEYSRWREFAVQGQTAVHARDVDACGRACKQCHDEYREAYRHNHRLLPIR